MPADDTALTAPNQSLKARNEVTYACRRFGNTAAGEPLEGSAMDGFVQGPDAVRTVLVSIRSLYDYQKFNFAGPCGENSWLEDYTAGVRGEPIGNFTVVARNAAGQAQHIVGNYRPQSTLLLLSRLVGEHFAGTPYAEHFLAGEP